MQKSSLTTIIINSILLKLEKKNGEKEQIGRKRKSSLVHIKKEYSKYGPTYFSTSSNKIVFLAETFFEQTF